MATTNAAAGAGSTTQPCRRAPQRRERQRRPEPGAGRRAEQVRVDERVAEHALVAGAGERQHRSDDAAEHDPRHADLPHDVPLGVADAAVDVDQRQLVEQLQRHPPPRRPGRADHRPERARRRRPRPTPADVPPARRRARRDDRDGRRHRRGGRGAGVDRGRASAGGDEGLLDGIVDLLGVLDDTGTPTRRDVVVHGEHVAVDDGASCRPTRGGRRPSPGSRRSTWCRRGRSGRGRRR